MLCRGGIAHVIPEGSDEVACGAARGSYGGANRSISILRCIASATAEFRLLTTVGAPNFRRLLLVMLRLVRRCP